MKTSYATILVALLAGSGLAAPVDTSTSPNPAYKAKRQVFWLNCTTPQLQQTCAAFNTRCNRGGFVSTDYPALCGEPHGCKCEYYGGCDTICRQKLGIEDDPAVAEGIKTEEQGQTKKEAGH
ncbi:hypothetical protein CH63R_12576 [Colletotrichum higginsianum IMI 349063]|uniref:Uncharacterized protein n=1 Tax=Colletotrichum higginsianum (strain IMI 349063) TaxID=759273 RepID=A0A1B7XUK9_COLHI|nr:hypothetical protein CH63R_12576 [Colletotrichum higginsianum IMI 349063]OBR03449.1 hypothetical protein CH63R_12576 [Colletotrichum higginsianum IMI 349063]